MLSHRFLAYVLAACSLIGLTTPPGAWAEAPRDSRVEPIAGKTFAAHDTLATGHEAELDARNCLEALAWEPNHFEVTLQVAKEHQGDVWVRFPSARPVGDATNDLAAMEWYQARDAAGCVIEAPAAVIVHESGSGMTVGRLIAKSLRSKGIHTFMLQLPYYGVRRAGERPQGERLIEALCQSIADARRARDAVAALPLVDASHISLQGTSLGGFVVATTAGLDRGYHSVFILLAGGDLAGVLANGKKDAQKVRQAMMAGGMGEGEYRQMLSRIEPLRLAHRIDANRTWLFSGSYDDVVPPHNSELLATSAHLPEGHHIRLLANHYSGIIFLPMISQQMSQHMRE
ncbi:MAG: prolyl oligopeptidase family serine peptidase [Planctomycetales bacterium]|nr:prolyl oligopeptidase family serine peptidase [Planctomycetales bacterium]